MPYKTCSQEIAKNKMERQRLNPFSLPCYAYNEDLHCRPTHKILPHWHHEFEILIVDCGEMKVYVSGKEFTLTQGQGYFLISNKLHSLSCNVSAPCRYRSVVFAPSIISGAEDSVFHKKYIQPLLNCNPDVFILHPLNKWQQPVFDALECIFSAYEEKSIGYEFTLRTQLSQIILLLIQNTSVKPSILPANSHQEERLKQMVAWLDVNYSKKIDLQSIASTVHISCRECERIFNQLLHISPMAYLLHRRITAASHLLASSSLSIMEVGLNCGFSSHSYFSKTFRSYTGTSPRDYRKNLDL